MMYDIKQLVMGYETILKGEFRFDRPLSEAHRKYLMTFCETRRVKRDPKKLRDYNVESNDETLLEDPVRLAAGLPSPGIDGEYFVGNTKNMGQDKDISTVDTNVPPSTQPSLWCDWIPNEDGTKIVIDDILKFYGHNEWLVYIIENFIKPWGYSMSGSVKWQGEEPRDKGVIRVRHNRVIITNN